MEGNSGRSTPYIDGNPSTAFAARLIPQYESHIRVTKKTIQFVVNLTKEIPHSNRVTKERTSKLSQHVSHQGTVRVARNPQTAWDIRGKVKAGKKLLDIGFMSWEDTKVDLKECGEIRDQVVGILREFGHQLETVIVEKEVYQESNRHLQGTSKLFNTTDRRQLSVARVLNGAELIRLPDARLTKDAKKALPHPVSRKKITPKRKPTKPPPITPTPPIRVQQILISNTPMVMFINPEVEASDYLEVEQLSANEWSTPHTTPRHTRRSSSIFAAPKSLLLDVPLHMRLRSRKP